MSYGRNYKSGQHVFADPLYCYIRANFAPILNVANHRAKQTLTVWYWNMAPGDKL